MRGGTEHKEISSPSSIFFNREEHPLHLHNQANKPAINLHFHPPSNPKSNTTTINHKTQSNKNPKKERIKTEEQRKERRRRRPSLPPLHHSAATPLTAPPTAIIVPSPVFSLFFPLPPISTPLSPSLLPAPSCVCG